VARLSAGTSDHSSLTLNYTGSTTMAGSVRGSAALTYTSKGQVGTGLADVSTGQANEVVTVQGNIYRLAQGTLGFGTSNLGNVRAGSSFGSGVVQVMNGAAADGFSDHLRGGASSEARVGLRLLADPRWWWLVARGRFRWGLWPGQTRLASKVARFNSDHVRSARRGPGWRTLRLGPRN